MVSVLGRARSGYSAYWLGLGLAGVKHWGVAADGALEGYKRPSSVDRGLDTSVLGIVELTGEIGASLGWNNDDDVCVSAIVEIGGEAGATLVFDERVIAGSVLQECRYLHIVDTYV